MLKREKGKVPKKIKEGLIETLTIWDLAFIALLFVFFTISDFVKLPKVNPELTLPYIGVFHLWTLGGILIAIAYIIFANYRLNKFLIRKYHTNIEEISNNEDKTNSEDASNASQEIIKGVLAKN